MKRVPTYSLTPEIEVTFNLYCLNLILCLQGQASQYLVLQHLCLCFTLGDMQVAMHMAYPSWVTNVTYICKRL
jgi:hypothetical protein